MKIVFFLTLLATCAFAGDNDRSLFAHQVKANVIGLDFGGISTSGSADIMYSNDPAVPAAVAGTRLAGYTNSGSKILIDASYGFSEQFAFEISASSGTLTQTVSTTPARVTKYSGMEDVFTSLKFRLDNGSHPRCGALG